jgi:hypothetical protein
MGYFLKRLQIIQSPESIGKTPMSYADGVVIGIRTITPENRVKTMGTTIASYTTGECNEDT